MIKWDDKKLKAEVRDKATKRLIRAAEEVRGICIKSMGSGKSGYKMRLKTKAKKEHWSSPPNTPPHVDTGRLRASITWALSEGQQQGNAVRGKAKQGDQVEQPVKEAQRIIAVVGTNVKYAKPLEFGTKWMMPRPFLRPALKQAAAKIRYLFAHE